MGFNIYSEWYDKNEKKRKEKRENEGGFGLWGQFLSQKGDPMEQ